MATKRVFKPAGISGSPNPTQHVILKVILYYAAQNAAADRPPWVSWHDVKQHFPDDGDWRKATDALFKKGYVETRKRGKSLSIVDVSDLDAALSEWGVRYLVDTADVPEDVADYLSPSGCNRDMPIGFVREWRLTASATKFRKWVKTLVQPTYLHESDGVGVRETTAIVKKIIYTPDEAKAEMARINALVKKGRIEKRSAGAFKAHISRRTKRFTVAAAAE